MVKILPEITKLNLHARESEILSYLYLNAPATAKQISKSLSISEQKIYLYIHSLLSRKFIDSEGAHPLKFSLGSSKIFKAELNKLKAELRTVESFIWQLAEKQKRVNRTENPFIQIGTTLKGNLELQLRAFNMAKKEFLQILNIHHSPQSNRAQKSEFERAIIMMLNRGVKYRVIYPEHKTIPKPLADCKFEVRRLNTQFQRCDVIDEQYVLLKILDEKDILNFIGIMLIDNHDLAKNLKKMFLRLWALAKGY